MRLPIQYNLIKVAFFPSYAYIKTKVGEKLHVQHRQFSAFNMNISVVTSNKGKEKLIVDGYSYHLNRKTKKTFNWVCSNQKNLSCKGRVVTRKVDDKHEILKSSANHSHEPLAFEKAVFDTNNLLKIASKNSDAAPAVIIADSITNTHSNSRVYLPSKKAQRIKIQRIRGNKIIEPDSFQSINIPENLKYVEGELFVLCDEEFDGDKIILMGTVSSLTLLAESNCWIMDGTFDVVPSIMRQLFSIHGNVEGQIVPLIFCLMSKKSMKVYDRLFFNLRKVSLELGINLKPTRIITDFEKAIVSSASAFFPEATFKGCLFHFGQIMWRRVQKLRLATRYANSEDFSIQIRMLKSLAFVPPNEIPAYYQHLYEKFDNSGVKLIGRWFHKNYIGEGNQRPRYSPQFWSIADADLGTENFPRTQNNVEAWHRRLKVVVGQRHAGVYKIIKKLSDELIVAKAQIEKVKSGERLPKKRKTIIKNKKIKRILKKQGKISKTDFLKRIAHNIILF